MRLGTKHIQYTTSTFFFLLCGSFAIWPPQRNERFSQGGPRGMGPGNLGYGRVREEFDGPAKKPRF